MKYLAIATAALGLVCSTATPVLAGNVERMSIDVKLSGINLATAEGQKTLDQRIEKAVRTVCRVTSPTTGSRLLTHEVRDCLARARTDARQQVAAITSNRQRGG